MEKNLKNLERRLIRIKGDLDLAPKQMKREFGWQLVRETLKDDFSGVMWIYDEMNTFVDKNFNPFKK